MNKNKPPRVLVVEDDQNMRNAISTRLVARGYDVLTSVDGRSCLQEAVRSRPDLIVMDICLPGGDGIATAERIQELEEITGSDPTPIIFLTASRQDWLRDRADAVGGVAFFNKPYDAEQLMAAVDAALVHAN